VCGTANKKLFKEITATGNYLKIIIFKQTNKNVCTENCSWHEKIYIHKHINTFLRFTVELSYY